MALLSLLCVFGLGQAAADTSLQAVVQSYVADFGLQNGMIVQLAAKDTTKVEPVDINHAQKMHGVVVPPADAAVTLSPTSTTQQQVFVATSGRYDVLVSTQNGNIVSGDYVTISSLDGIGMKATSKEGQVLGKATATFDGVHGVQSTTTVKDQDGKSRTVVIGRVPVEIAIGSNPDAERLINVPGFLQRTSQLVAGKSVSPWRIYVSLLILLGTLIVTGSLLYGGVRSGMVAIGRNPLARTSISRSLLQVVLAAIAVFVIGLLAVYLLLKL